MKYTTGRTQNNISRHLWCTDLGIRGRSGRHSILASTKADTYTPRASQEDNRSFRIEKNDTSADVIGIAGNLNMYYIHTVGSLGEEVGY